MWRRWWQASYTAARPAEQPPKPREPKQPSEQAWDMGDGRVYVECMTNAEMHSRFKAAEKTRLRWAGSTWTGKPSGHVIDREKFPPRYLLTFQKRQLTRED